MDIRDFLRTIGRHRLVFLIIVGIFVGGGATAAFLRPNRYEAKATIYLGQPLSPNGTNQIQSLSTNPATARR